MKISKRGFKFANYLVENRPPLIPFYVSDKKEKLSPSDYQTYKMWINPKDKKSAVYLLMAKYYKVELLKSGFNSSMPSHKLSKDKAFKTGRQPTPW
eukprot:4034295-Ditylum_brightwellii.AAC.1